MRTIVILLAGYFLTATTSFAIRLTDEQPSKLDEVCQKFSRQVLPAKLSLPVPNNSQK